MFIRSIRGSIRPFYESDGKGNGDTQSQRTRATEVHDRFAGDAMRMAERLSERENENYSLREERRQLREEIEQLKKRVPADGSVVLSAEDAKSWEAFRAIGKSPEEIGKAISEGATAQEQVTESTRRDGLRAAAAAHNLNADALMALNGLPTVIVKDGTVDGKPAKQAFVQQNGSETPLVEYGKQHYAALWSAVEATDTQQQSTQKTGTYVPPQGNGGGKAKGSAASSYAQSNYSLPGKKATS